MYFFQPKHMNVNYPSNVDDEFITPTEVMHDFPLTSPTPMTAFIHRVKLASLCREIVDTIPSTFLEPQELEYDVILGLDKKFQQFLQELPVFFRLDPDSIQRSQEICQARPYLAWQRINIHFSLHTRLCRLHRPYHLEGMTNGKYAYSHTMCIRSAQTILELWRSMDDAGARVGMKPARIWTVIQHFFFAVLILATDVSSNPNAPDATARKAKVLAAYQTLENSKEESRALVESIQRNMQTVMSTLQKRRSPTSSSRPNATAGTVSIGQNSEMFREPLMDDGESRADNMQPLIPPTPTAAGEELQSSNLISEAGTGAENWDQLWSDFIAIAPELEASQWTSLLDDMDFGFDPNV